MTPDEAPRPRTGWLRLPAGNKWYVLSLYGPLLLVELLFQAMRMHRMGVHGALALLDGMRPVLAFGLALILFWMAVLAFVRSRPGRVLVAIALHVTFTVLAILAVLNHLYFLRADIVLNLYSLELVPLLFDSHIADLVAGEVPVGLLAVGLLMILLANWIPPFLNRWWAPRWLWQSYDGAPAGLRPLPIAGVLVVLLALAVLPDASGGYRSDRSRVVDLAAEGISNLTEHDPKGFEEPKLADLPLNTRLVRDGSGKRRNVVLILVESLRASATTVYNPDLPTTPNLVKLAKSSIVADRAYTALTHTTKSLISTHCGVAPPLESFSDDAGSVKAIARCLPALLGAQGYRTAYFQSATGHFEDRDKVVSHFGFDDFFPLEKFDKKGFLKVNGFGYEDDIMAAPSVAWAKKQTSPFLMSMLTVTSHYDYTLPANYPAKHFVKDPVENRYLNAVQYSDRFVGKVIDGFKRAGLYDNTIFIVTGDHGEAFYEHGRRSHNDSIWSEGTQVPLIISTPESRRHHGRITRPVQLTAMLPTVADLLGYRIEGGAYDQHSMFAKDDEDLHISCWDQKQCLALVRGQYKFNHFFGYRQDGYYNVVKDPGEKHNLIDSLSGAQVDELREQLDLWRAEVQARYDLARAHSD